MARNPDEGDSETVSFVVPAGLYHFLTMHARRAIYGKNPGEVALYLIQEAARIWDREGTGGVHLPDTEFRKTDGGGGGA